MRKILMLSKLYESTEVDCRTWVHVLSDTGSPNRSTEESSKLKKAETWQDKMVTTLDLIQVNGH